MRPFFLRFDSRAQALSILAGWLKPDAQGAVRDDASGIDWAVHVVGDVYTAGVKQPGYHVNVLTDSLPDAVLPYAITPANPRNVFAGWQDWTEPK